MELEIFQSFSANQGYGNKRCSGYALAPVLMDMDGNRWHSLLGNDCDSWNRWIYDRLAECQNGFLEQCGGQSASVGFVRSPDNICNGTCMILPSAIVSRCKAWGCAAGVQGRDVRSGQFFPSPACRIQPAGWQEFRRVGHRNISFRIGPVAAFSVVGAIFRLFVKRISLLFPALYTFVV